MEFFSVIFGLTYGQSCPEHNQISIWDPYALEIVTPLNGIPIE